jgi:hypothetical protein
MPLITREEQPLERVQYNPTHLRVRNLISIKFSGNDIMDSIKRLIESFDFPYVHENAIEICERTNLMWERLVKYSSHEELVDIFSRMSSENVIALFTKMIPVPFGFSNSFASIQTFMATNHPKMLTDAFYLNSDPLNLDWDRINNIEWSRVPLDVQHLILYPHFNNVYGENGVSEMMRYILQI